MLLFDLDPDASLGPSLAAALGTTLAPRELRRFSDGECKVRPLVDPRGRDAWILQSLHGGAAREPAESPCDRLVRLLMFAATLRDHGAARVGAVIPYLAYARKDRRTQPFDPVGQRVVAQLLEAAGVQQVVALEPHNVAAFDNAFRIPARAVASAPAFDALVDALPHAPLAVASPDPGGVKRAQLWRERVESRVHRPVGFAIVDKRRSAGLVGGTEHVAGEVEGAIVLLVDDLVATGETLLRAARALRHRGARQVVACAAHGLFVDGADQALGDPAIDRVVVCDSVPAFRVAGTSPLQRKLSIVSCAHLLAAAMRDDGAADLATDLTRANAQTQAHTQAQAQAQAQSQANPAGAGPERR